MISYDLAGDAQDSIYVAIDLPFEASRGIDPCHAAYLVY
jgi:hypothetical protein